MEATVVARVTVMVEAERAAVMVESPKVKERVQVAAVAVTEGG